MSARHVNRITSITTPRGKVLSIKGPGFEFEHRLSGLLSPIDALRRDAQDARAEAEAANLRADRLESAALLLENNQ